MKKEYNTHFIKKATELGWNCTTSQNKPHLIMFSRPVSNAISYTFLVPDNEELLAEIIDQCGSFEADIYIYEQMNDPDISRKVPRNKETLSEEAQNIAEILEELGCALEEVANDLLIEKLMEKAEKLGWSYNYDDKDGIEIGKPSPAGEDFWIYIDRNMAVEDTVSTYDDFDIEEHVFTLLQAKRNGTGGVPDLKTLVDDADAICEMLRELSTAFEETEKDFLA